MRRTTGSTSSRCTTSSSSGSCGCTTQARAGSSTRCTPSRRRCAARSVRTSPTATPAGRAARTGTGRRCRSTWSSATSRPASARARSSSWSSTACVSISGACSGPCSAASSTSRSRCTPASCRQRPRTTATPYARNAIFSGRYPDAIARSHPGWWETEEGSLNAFEDELLREQLRELTGRDVPVHYEKVFTDTDSEDMVQRVRGALRNDGVVAAVFNFVDLLTHGRSEAAILMEVARDVPALRSLTRQWFERSSALRVLREVAARGATIVLTTGHCSIL